MTEKCKHQQRGVASRSFVGCIWCEFDRLHAEKQRLLAWKDDIENATRAALDESCDANEAHCTCVPLLRAENQRLREFVSEVSRINRWLDRTGRAVSELELALEVVHHRNIHTKQEVSDG